MPGSRRRLLKQLSQWRWPSIVSLSVAVASLLVRVGQALGVCSLSRRTSTPSRSTASTSCVDIPSARPAHSSLNLRALRGHGTTDSVESDRSLWLVQGRKLVVDDIMGACGGLSSRWMVTFE